MKKAIYLAVCAFASSLTFAGCSNISASSAAANRYAIVIGVSVYDDHYNEGKGPNLSYPDNDAEDVATLLASKGWTVKYSLINNDAAQDKIEADISALADSIGSNTSASVLVYYSGHGDLNSSGEACIIPQDACVATSSSYSFDKTKYISAAKMSNLLGALTCKNKILILDSCYSGGFVDTGDSIDAIPSSYGSHEGGTESSFLAAALGNFGSLLQNSVSSSGDPTVLTITAAGADEYSYDDSDHGHGAFTYYLLQAATSGDTDGDGYVTSTEAYAYAKAKIKNVWDAAYASTTSSEFLYYQAYYQYYYGYHITSWSDIYALWGYVPDFMPHISGGTGDLVLYDNN